LELDGTLTMDETEFDEKLAANPDLLASLFTDSDSGLMVALEDAIEGMVDDSTDVFGNELPGAFERRRDTLESLNDDLDDQIEQLEYNIGQKEATLIQQFSALEELMAGLNSQGQYLANALSQL
ncbi:MAG: flagellar filament capping protein FliD, partial [Planctomycetota bacterium]